jgi:transposase
VAKRPREPLTDFYNVADADGLPECDRLARTIRRWEAQLPAYYRSDGLSNVRSESTNALIKKIKRVGHGFRNLGNYRLRLCCTAAAPPGTVHLPRASRGRPARFAA